MEVYGGLWRLQDVVGCCRRFLEVSRSFRRFQEVFEVSGGPWRFLEALGGCRRLQEVPTSCRRVLVIA